MGNAGSNVTRERHKSNSTEIGVVGSPSTKEEPFVLEKKIFQGNSQEEEIEEPYYTKIVPQDPEFVHEQRPRASTLSEKVIPIEDEALGISSVLPTVFKWDGGGKQVFISGTFTGWKVLPMVRSHGDFVTILDIPEGDHEYKFFVDGEWRHDPKIVGIDNFFLIDF